MGYSKKKKTLSLSNQHSCDLYNLLIFCFFVYELWLCGSVLKMGLTQIFFFFWLLHQIDFMFN